MIKRFNKLHIGCMPNIFTLSKNLYSTTSGADSDEEMSSNNSDTGNAEKVNPSDGYGLDDTRDIIKFCSNSREVKEYFTTKENSIRNSYRMDSNTGAASGLPSSELQKWSEDRDDLISSLNTSKQ
jgi:hypothetical protein